MTDYVVSSGVSSGGITLGNGDSLTVLAGGTATSTTIDSGGIELVSSGGTATSTSVTFGGVEIVSSGGLANDTSVTAGVLDVYGSSVDTVLFDVGYENVYQGGVASGTTLNSVTLQQIYTGGVASGAVINSGGGQYVYSSGETVDTLVNSSGVELAYRLGTADATTIENGGLVVVQPTAVVSDPNLQLGGEIVSTGVAVLDAETGGVQLYAAVASGLTIGDQNGREYVLPGGTAISNTILSSVDQEVYSGGVTEFTSVESGGTERLQDGASYNTYVYSGGLERVQFDAVTDATILSGGEQVVSDTGTALSTTIGAGGYQIVSYGGSAVSNTVANDGFQYVSHGGLAIATTVASGIEYLAADGVTSDTIVSASAGASEASEQIYSEGTAIGTTLESGGGEYVIALGVADSTTISGGGLQYVEDEGTAISSTIEAGGTEFAYSGAVLEGSELLSGGRIDLGYLAYSVGGTAVLNSSTDLLTVTAGSATAQVQMLGDYSGQQFDVTSSTEGGVNITLSPAPCFCAGTLILTTRGEVPVEHLTTGDQVVVHDGGGKPIRWIGRRRIVTHHHPAPEKVHPIRIEAHAFGRLLPHRDLFLSPDHCVFVENVLIPIRHLVNEATIRQIAMPEVRYFHLELDRHDVLWANGLPAESYLDTGDRTSFENAAPATVLHPAFGSERGDTALVMDAAGYAPLRVTGVEVERARAALSSLPLARPSVA